MSDALKVGDRVRVVGCEKMKPLDVFAARIMHGEVKGEIQSLHGTWSIVNFEGHNYHMKNANLQRIPSRTFDEICKELAGKPCMADWKMRFMDCGAHYADFECDYLAPLLIYTNGEVWWARDDRRSWLGADQLAAIAAACQEIAANYAAEHGKENK